MSASATVVRLADTGDLGRIAEIHSRSWETAYRGMLPDHFFEGVIVRHQAQWVSVPSDGFLLVAEEGTSLVGFASVRAGQPQHGEQLLDNLHVDPDRRSAGIGKMLLETVFDLASARDPGGILYLWVFEANLRGRQFYVREGGTEGETRVEVLSPSVEVIERQVWWRV